MLVVVAHAQHRADAQIAPVLKRCHQQNVLQVQMCQDVVCCFPAALGMEYALAGCWRAGTACHFAKPVSYSNCYLVHACVQMNARSSDATVAPTLESMAPPAALEHLEAQQYV